MGFMSNYVILNTVFYFELKQFYLTPPLRKRGCLKGGGVGKKYNSKIAVTLEKL